MASVGENPPVPPTARAPPEPTPPRSSTTSAGTGTGPMDKPPSTNNVAAHDGHGHSQRNARHRIRRAFRRQLGQLHQAVWGESFALLFMFVVLFALEVVTKYDTTDYYLRQFKTVVPYAAVSFITTQFTRLVYALQPVELAAPAALYLSFVPFPLFCVFSRENHNYLPLMLMMYHSYLLITLTLHMRRIETRRAKKIHFGCAVLLYLFLYIMCVWFMSEFYVDSTGLHRFYGRVLTKPVYMGDELVSMLTATLVSSALWVQEESNADRHQHQQHQQQPHHYHQYEDQTNQPALAASRQLSAASSSSHNLALTRSLSAGILGRFAIPYEDLNLTEADLIGRGTYGNVYRCMFENDVVAVKKVTESTFSLQEADILSILSHKYITRFKGISFREPHDIFIVLEYAENGSLYDYLATCRKSNQAVPFDILKRWSRQIAQGMMYLHSGAPRQIIHRDLKSKNILLDKNMDVKISDFGWSRMNDNGSVTNQAMTNSVGTCAWMAPEVIRGADYTEKIDVWSFGVVIWEIVTGQVPYEGMHPTSIMFGVGRDPPLLELPIPDDCPEAFNTVMRTCWQRDPAERPQFNWLHRYLHEALDDKAFHSYTSFTMNQLAWREEINDRVKSQQLRVAAELSIVDARVKNTELMERAKVLKEREDILRKKEEALRRRERALFISTVTVLVVMVVFLFRDVIESVVRSLVKMYVREFVGLLSEGAHKFITLKEDLLK